MRYETDLSELDMKLLKQIADEEGRSVRKQRLSAVIEFIEDKFEDEFGNKYSDLSSSAKRKFADYQGMQYGEMDEACSPEQICDAFLNNAVSGTPISKEHIKFMEETRKTLLRQK